MTNKFRDNIMRRCSAVQRERKNFMYVEDIHQAPLIRNHGRRQYPISSPSSHRSCTRSENSIAVPAIKGRDFGARPSRDSRRSAIRRTIKRFMAVLFPPSGLQATYALNLLTLRELKAITTGYMGSADQIVLLSKC